MAINKILPIILCGGSGTRLWPLSRESFPKQFLNVTSNSKRTLLQQTLERLNLLGKLLNPILICNEEHRFILAEQIREIGVVPNSIILEPFPRNTAAPIALAALKSLDNFEKNQDPILLVLSSDHIIGNNENFIKSLKSALDLAGKGRLVTFGCVPHSAETGFGYIQATKELDMNSLTGSEIKKFIEKPNKNLAEQLIKDKRYLWNSGMFVFKSTTIIEEFEKYASELLRNCRSAISNDFKDYDFQRLNKNAFAKCQSISIDVAVMEKTSQGIVIPLDVGWSDVGSWDIVWKTSDKDNDGNCTEGKVVLENTKNSFFRSEDRLIVGINLNNLIVVDTRDAILISDKKSSQAVKNIVNQLKKSKIPIKIFQQCPIDQNDYLTKFYKDVKIDCEIFNFSSQIIDYYHKANLVITRAGASVLGELININKLFISIPLPSSADNHQLKNAEYYASKGFGFLIDNLSI